MSHTYRTTRRGIIRVTKGAVLAAGLLAAAGRQSCAQDIPMATPNALGPAMPPELTTYATDWPAPHGNLIAHRAAATSPITAATVGQH